ncbi:hypothetical protein M434DRAFT_274416 [Hypoxylon sp. CO27-5]|nr:hypothetical protein M434DRAFT_274416 [Hypoxylon sp. CO27-5]
MRINSGERYCSGMWNGSPFISFVGASCASRRYRRIGWEDGNYPLFGNRCSCFMHLGTATILCKLKIVSQKPVFRNSLGPIPSYKMGSPQCFGSPNLPSMYTINPLSP